MPLYVRDDDVGQLARQMKDLTGVRTVSDAVRTALRHELDRVRNTMPLPARLDKALSLADEMGPTDPAFDMKTFSDEMWEHG